MHTPREAPRRRPAERRRVGAQAGEFLLERNERRVVEAGSDPASVAQLAVFLVNAEQQRAQALPRAAGRRVPGDDELLALAAFELDPVARSLMTIDAGGALADDAFESHFARLRQHLRSTRGERRRKTQGRARIQLSQRALERVPALDERQRAQVPSVEKWRIEQEIKRGAFSFAGERALQGRKARAPARIENADLAIEPGRTQSERGKIARDVRKARRPVESLARAEPDRALVDARHNAIAVVLDLVQPPVIGRRGIDQRRQFGFEMRRQRPHGLACRWRNSLRWRSRRRLRARLRLLAAGGDVLDQAPRFDALGRVLEQVGAMPWPRFVVALLDQQPRFLAFLAPALHAHQRPAATQLLSRQRKFQMTLAVAPPRIAFGTPRTAIPQYDRSRAVLLFRDHALEVAIGERMILDVDGEPLVRRIEAGALRHRPAFERSVELETEVVMQAAGRVLLHDKAQP